MSARSAAILRWTGRGSFADLQSSVNFVLKDNGVQGQVRSAGNSVIVEGSEPLGVAEMFEHMPGVAWTAAGIATNSFKGLVGVSGDLARKYLRRGDRFAVEAEGVSNAVASDVVGAVTSRILDTVKGVRVSIEVPRVRFRAAYDGSRGTVGVEVKRGPGGVPTGRDSVVCLVSGGSHSSVVAWMATLMGFRVRLVHAKSKEEGLRAVARLYSELSHRADPRGLRLEVLEGSSESDALPRHAARSRDPVFGGFHAAGGGAPRSLRGSVKSPLYLMPEERFISEFESLRLKGYDSLADWKVPGSKKFTVRTFGGVAADVSDVLDGLR